tara:strand:- start:955 stop:2028 length:1074 start_codon:yes stop_codon:yes gene_type:complete
VSDSVSSGGIFDLDVKVDRQREVSLQLQDSSIWQQQELYRSLSQELTKINDFIERVETIEKGIKDNQELLHLAKSESDEALAQACEAEVDELDQVLKQFELQRMFNQPHDDKQAYLVIQAGSGGTEAQDWAEMLLRMYLRWCDRKSFDTILLECSPGEVAGIKSATLHVQAHNAYGWLRTESGVHRLVRKSPFDSGNRRHTSFAAVFVTPELDDAIEIDLDMSDCRIDTYRASGAGGQHVNKTDSAVRITHLPSNIVVQCQSERSQHQNKDRAIKQLKARLYQQELDSRQADLKEQESQKQDISWGSQIRSYVLDQSRVKDLRTHVEVSQPQSVLDGDLDQFIEASLKQMGDDHVEK